MIKKIILGVETFWWEILSIIIISWLFYIGWNCHQWTGNNCTGFIGKTVWDVLELLIIPATLAGVAIVLDRLERKADREIAKDNQSEMALQNYFDAMTRLLLDYKLRESKEGDEVRTIAQAKTISILKTLDINRKNKLINFLCVLGLMDDDIILAIGVCIPLENAILDGCDFSNMYLFGAKFGSAHLEGANFVKADIQGCDFVSADLKGADFHRARLNSSNMNSANLQNANFTGASLEAVNLKDANLKGVIFIDAKMPDGRVFDSAIHSIEILTGESG